MLLDSAAIEIGCDFEGGLKCTLLSNDKYPLYYVYGSQLDLVNAISHVQLKSIIKMKGRHILSHQDDSCIYNNIDFRG